MRRRASPLQSTNARLSRPSRWTCSVRTTARSCWVRRHRSTTSTLPSSPLSTTSDSRQLRRNSMPADNIAWQLEDFVDSLVVELDKTRETLAVKAINKPLTYTVKEVALDLNIFPSYDGDLVK